MTETAWPFGSLRPSSYDLIMADPPWTYKNYSKKGEGKGAAAQYSCMSLDDIKALPVANLAAPDCLLWLWATNPLLPRCVEVMDAWGFNYVTAGTWSKRTKNGLRAFGTGYVLRSACEPFLIGRIGRPVTAKNVRSLLEGPVRGHSRKPDEAYADAERLVPETRAGHAVRRADLFARETRPGWDGWGDEASKFDRVAA